MNTRFPQDLIWEAKQLLSEEKLTEAFDKYVEALHAVTKHALSYDNNLIADFEKYLSIYFDDLIQYSNKKISEIVNSLSTHDRKKEALNKILPLPHPLKMLLLRRALQKGNPLGDLMWEKKGLTEPSLTSGTLEQIKKVLDSSTSGYAYQTPAGIKSLWGNDSKNVITVLTDQMQEIQFSDITFPIYYLERGKAYKALGDLKSAIVDLTRAIAIEPNNPEAYFKRADAYFRLGNKEEALADYKKFTDLTISDFMKIHDHSIEGQDQVIAYEKQINILKHLGKDIDFKLLELVYQLAKDEKLNTSTNRAHYLIDRIKLLDSPTDKLHLLYQILDPASLLGTIALEGKKKLDSKIIKKIQIEIDFLQEPNLDNNKQTTVSWKQANEETSKRSLLTDIFSKKKSEDKPESQKNIGLGLGRDDDL